MGGEDLTSLEEEDINLEDNEDIEDFIEDSSGNKEEDDFLSLEEIDEEGDKKVLEAEEEGKGNSEKNDSSVSSLAASDDEYDKPKDKKSNGKKMKSKQVK